MTALINNYVITNSYTGTLFIPSSVVSQTYNLTFSSGSVNNFQMGKSGKWLLTLYTNIITSSSSSKLNNDAIINVNGVRYTTPPSGGTTLTNKTYLVQLVINDIVDLGIDYVQPPGLTEDADLEYRFTAKYLSP